MLQSEWAQPWNLGRWLQFRGCIITLVKHRYYSGVICQLLSWCCLLSRLWVFLDISRAHLEQRIGIDIASHGQVELLDLQIAQKKEAIVDIEKRITLVNNALQSLIDQKKALQSIRTGDDQRKNRDALNSQRNQLLVDINKLEIERLKTEGNNEKLQLEVGPIKYVAELIYGSTDQAVVDKTVRALIVVIVCVFDPLAIALLLAAQTGILTNREEESSVKILKERIHDVDQKVL